MISKYYLDKYEILSYRVSLKINLNISMFIHLFFI